MEGMLSPYRVLDMSFQNGLLCGRLLADLGADVVQIEPPGGSPARKIGPFFRDDFNPEKSLYWFAYSANKRGITLNIESEKGSELLKKMVAKVDFLIESFEPDYLNKLGLGYSDLEKINPRLIMISITNFGQTGPYKYFKAPGIVSLAISGGIAERGNPERAPVMIGPHSHADLFASISAAEGAMVAFSHRKKTGHGQHVDVSMQECLIPVAYVPISQLQISGEYSQRGAATAGNVSTKGIWRCKDGFVYWRLTSGSNSVKGNGLLLEWIKSEGMSNDFLDNYDWNNLDLREISKENLDLIYAPITRFFLAHSKKELMDGSISREIIMYPISDVKDILEDVQLAAREYFILVDHPELKTNIAYPGPFCKASLTPPVFQRRAPLIGEHNLEVYQEILNVSPNELVKLKDAGVI